MDFDAPEPSDATERERKKEKDKRYEKNAFLVRTPMPDYSSSILYDNEPLPSSAFPFNQSKLVITGAIIGSRAAVSSNKAAVYSEYDIQVESVLKQSGGREFQPGHVLSADRLGGKVRYSNGAVMLYLNDWQDLPEPFESYLFFLDNEGGKDPNYKIVTAYKTKDDNVTALDSAGKFREHNGRKKDEFIKLAKQAAKEATKGNEK